MLESHHVAYAFNLTKNESLNIFADYSVSDYKSTRSKAIEFVLATDMAYHFANLGTLKNKISSNGNTLLIDI